MILHEYFRTEANYIHQELQTSILNRQYHFLRSIVGAAINADFPFLSQTIIKALNFGAYIIYFVHNISCTN